MRFVAQMCQKRANLYKSVSRQTEEEGQDRLPRKVGKVGKAFLRRNAVTQPF